MSQNAFIFMLVLGMTVLAGILTVVHVSAYRLKKRLELRRYAGALAPDIGSMTEPELDLQSAWFGDNQVKSLSVQARRAETAR